MARVTRHVILAVFLCNGCSTDAPTSAPRDDRDSSSDVSSAAAVISTSDVESERAESDQGSANADVVTRGELDAYRARFDDASVWHYGEGTDGELEGTWISVDGDGHRIVFGPDGLFSEDFNGNMTTGQYAISDTGRIVAFSKWDGISLGSHFQLDGETITGPKGPNPHAEWRRAAATE